MKKFKGLIIGGVAIALVAVLIVGVVFFAIKTTVKDSDIVATVNGNEICAEEFKLQCEAQKGYVIDDFGENKTIDDKFWKTEINGTTPLETLKQRVLEYFTRYKVEQQIAVQCGVITTKDMSYNSFINAMQNENAIREQKIKRGEVIYGVKQYTYNSYLTYTYSNMQIDSREVLSKKGGALYATDKELEAWYESVKDERYPKFDTMKFDYYKIPWNDVISPTDAENEAKYAREGIVKYGETDCCDIEHIDLTIDDDNASDLQKTSPQFFEVIKMMKVGDVTEVINENNSSFFAVLKSAKKAGYKALEDYKDSIYTEYMDVKYEAYVDDLVTKAKVEKTEKFKYLELE